MSHNAEHVALLRSLKRTAAVYLVLLYLNKPTSEAEVSEILGINIETARSHLKALASSKINLVTRTHHYSGWMLTGGGRQLVLGNAENPRSLPTTTTTAIGRKSENREAAAAESAFERGKSADERGKSAFAELKKWGVTQPTAGTLAGLDYVTPEYIQALAEDLRNRNRFTPALLVHRIRSHDKIDVTDNYEYRQSEEGRAKYAEWENNQ